LLRKQRKTRCLLFCRTLYLMCVSPSVSHPYFKFSIFPYDLPLNALPTSIYRIPSRFKPAYQLEMVVLGWDVCLRSHFLPFWLQRHAHSHSRTTFWLDAFPSDNTYRQTYLSSWSVAFGTVLDPPSTKQLFYDRPRILHDISVVESGLLTPIQQAAFKTAQFHHSGDRLFALPIVSCGLCLDDKASESHTNVTVSHWLMPTGFTVSSAWRHLGARLDSTPWTIWQLARLSLPAFQLPRNRSSGISRSSNWWQMPLRDDTYSMGWRQTFDMGRHGCLSSCDVVSGIWMRRPTARGWRQKLQLSVRPSNMQTWGPSIFSSSSRLSHWATGISQQDNCFWLNSDGRFPLF